jgi:outer membrane protein assembly factor BamB
MRRRGALRFLASATALASLGPGRRALAQTSAASWPQFRGNPALTGVAAAAPAPPLRVLWTQEAGEVIESSAAIADDTAFVGVQPGALLALDLAKGTPRWKYAIEGDGVGESSPCVAAGLVYVGDLAGIVHAVDAKTGTKAWTFATGKEVKASPIVAGDKLLVGSYDGHLYALDARTGSVVWKTESEGPVHATAAVFEGTTYITGCDQRLRGIRIADGKQVLDVSSGAYTGASPAIAGGVAYYGTFENEVLAVDLKATKILWRYKHPERNFPFYSSAAVSDAKVVLGGRDKLVHAIDARTGKGIWTFTTQARVDSSPLIAGERATARACFVPKVRPCDLGRDC